MIHVYSLQNFGGKLTVSCIDSKNRKVLLKRSKFYRIKNVTNQRTSFYSYATIPSSL